MAPVLRACKNLQAVPGQASANVRDRHLGVTADRDIPRPSVVVRGCPSPVTQEVAGSSPVDPVRSERGSRGNVLADASNRPARICKQHIVRAVGLFPPFELGSHRSRFLYSSPNGVHRRPAGARHESRPVGLERPHRDAPVLPLSSENTSARCRESLQNLATVQRGSCPWREIRWNAPCCPSLLALRSIARLLRVDRVF
jgi:hypothetical protein